MNLKRIDQVIFLHFSELSRTKIQALIERKKIFYLNSQKKWEVVPRASWKVNPTDFHRTQLKILEDEEVQYVSRGALKLQKALDEFNVPVQGKVALDIGLSTGGFTDLLLKRGAKKILGIDVGQGQLHPSLQKHEKLMWQDKVNARNPLPMDLLKKFFKGEDHKFDLIVIDVSFISLKLILKPLLPLLERDGKIIALVKPQFELNKEDLNKQGVVKSVEKNRNALSKIHNFVESVDLAVFGHCPSPIQGAYGNQEYLLVLTIKDQ